MTMRANARFSVLGLPAVCRRSGVTILAAGLLSGCLATAGDKVATVAQPKTPVAKTITSLDQAKRCMDQLFLEYRKKPVRITTGLVDDATSSIQVSEQDMIINAIGEMTVRSRAFEYVAMEASGSGVGVLQQAFAPLQTLSPESVPAIYIRGSISQSDSNVTSDNAGVGVTLPFASISAGQGQVAGTISVDLQLADVGRRTILPGAVTSNTITILSADESGQARGLINDGGFGGALSISLRSAEREGKGQAVRTLIEYSLIELLGRYRGVPYHRCLSLDSTDPASMQKARDIYDDLSPIQRIRAVQVALWALGHYDGVIDGRMSRDLEHAITAAKAERGLISNGRIDFQLFNALYEENLLPLDSGGKLQEEPKAIPVSAAPNRPTSGHDPLGLAIALTDPRPAIGDTINVRIATNAPARVYCYYEYVVDATLVTARIFPNRFQTDNRVRPGRPVLVPDPSTPFQIRVNDEREEIIACVATTVDYTPENRPAFLAQPDLEPIRCGYSGTDCAVHAHHSIDLVNTSTRTVSFRGTR